MLSTRQRLQARQGKYGTPRHEYLQQLVQQYHRTSDPLRKEEIVANLGNFAYDPINFATLSDLNVMRLWTDLLVEFQRAASLVDGGDGGGAAAGNAFSRPQRTTGNNSTLLKSQRLAEFALGGICNCAADPVFQQQLLSTPWDSAAIASCAAAAASIVDDNTQAEEQELAFAVVDLILWFIDTFSSAAEDCEEQEDHHHNETEDHEDDCQQQRDSSFRCLLSSLTICYFLLDSAAFAQLSNDQTLQKIQHLALARNPQIANLAQAFTSRIHELLQSTSSMSSDSAT